MLGDLPDDVVDYATRGNKSRRKGMVSKTRLEQNERQRERREATLAGMRLNKRATQPLSRRPDLFVVLRADIVEIIGPWIERQNDEAYGGASNYIGGNMYLASEIGCHPDAIRNVLRRGGKYVSYGFADELLVALNQHIAFQDGRVPVYANPYISFRKWCERAAEEDIDHPAEMWFEHSPPEAWAA